MPPLGPEDAARYRKRAASARENTALRTERCRLEEEKEIAALRAANEALRAEIKALRSRSSHVQLNEQARVKRE